MNVFAWGLVWLVLCACDKPKEGSSSLTKKVAEPAHAKQEAAKPQPAGPLVETEGFRLEAKETASWQSGREGSVKVSLTAKGIYHVNQEFPIEVVVEPATGVEIKKDRLTRQDAEKFDKTAAVFSLPITPATAGSHELKMKVSFAVCTDQNCVPDERVLALNIRAGDAK